MKFTSSLLLLLSFCGIILLVIYTDKKNVNKLIENKNTCPAPAEEFAGEDEAEGDDKPLQFFLFHKEIRTRDNQTQPDYKVGYRSQELSLARNSVLAKQSQGRTKANGVLAWTERGPGNIPGRTRALFNIPEINNNTWLAGAATGGIWKTSDGGTSWQEKNENLTALPISSFAADANATVIYAGTGELVSSAYSAMGDGIFKSTDKGETWTQLPSTQANPDFAVITRLIVHPSNPNIILATTAPPSSNLTDNTSAIMRTSNGGGSWSKAKEITGTFDQIIFTPGNFQIQYASQNNVGVWKSIDGGVTWNLSNTGMSVSGRVELAVSGINPAKVFASAEGEISGVESDLYVSSNAGATWSLVDVKFNDTVVDFLGNSPTEPDSQGFYDNTIICDPFNENIIYFGGVNLFRTTLGTASSSASFYSLEEISTANFLALINFSGGAAQGRLDVGPSANETDVEIRFGPGKSQKAHRFLVPEGATTGVADGSYTYQDLVDVPFEVWDITNNRQLMVSFRDQGRDGTFNLIEESTSALPATSQSREYMYINNVTYNTSPSPNITVNGGHQYNMMYNVWPVLSSSGTWPPTANGTLKINASSISKINANTITVADGYGNFDSKNIMSQEDLESGVHVDHHTMVPVIINATAKTYKILLGNDGGVFVSNTNTTPGTTEGAWQFKGYGYNTGQFYGADKKPGSDRYIGGMQDNGTRISPANQTASAQSHYGYAIGGDGFEVIWNNVDETKILGSVYYGQIYRSNNGGSSWTLSTGLGDGTNFPFITKLANSRDFPNRVFTVSGSGVHVSDDFSATWTLQQIDEKFITASSSSLDVEVSRANANIVWAGSGMSNISGQERNLFVSTDGGETFESTPNYSAVTLGSITKLASHPTEANTAYALFSFADGPKILRTKNLGQTWQDISGFNSGSASTNGFPDVAVYSLYVRPDNPSIIWAGTEIGIVESQDDGLTWTLLEDFPKVSVWDMKGQDNQVVIATHGRGIWTATIDQPQTNYIKDPEIIASGTSPDKRLVLRLESERTFDSLEIYVDETLVKTVVAIEIGTIDVALSGISSGNKKIHLVSFDDGAPHQSKIYTITQLDILALRDEYATYFSQLDDLTLKSLTLQNFSNLPATSRMVLHTAHPYSINNTYSVLFRTPVKVSSSFPKLFYSDLAIVEPDEDSVVVEASKNGIDWIPLSPSYDAGKNTTWQSAYTNNQLGVSTMLVQNEIDISETFVAGDSLLFRLRMISGTSTTAWGWAIDFISIQQLPVSTEQQISKNPFTLYPNPSTGLINVRYGLQKPSEVTVDVIDLFGRVITKKSLGKREAGENTDPLNLEDQASGTYLVRITTEEGSAVTKLVLRR